METPAETKLLLRRTAHSVLNAGLIEGAAAAGALLWFAFVWRIFLPFSVALAIGVYFGVLLVLQRPTRSQLLVQQMAVAEVPRVLDEMAARVACIETRAEFTPAPFACAHLQVIARTARSILARLQERPRHVTGARFVFESLLDAASKASVRCEMFSGVNGPAAQRGREVLEHRAFPAITRGLQQLLEKLVQDDVRALNVDIVVLEQMLDLEGLSEAEPVHEDQRGVA